MAEVVVNPNDLRKEDVDFVFRLGGTYTKKIDNRTFYGILINAVLNPTSNLAVGQITAIGYPATQVVSDGSSTGGWKHVSGGAPLSKLGA